MVALTHFIMAFTFSFIGSIPPGTLNLTVIQLGLDNKIKTAIRFATTACLVEYPYAWIAVKFERIITSTPIILENVQLVGAMVMTTLGIINLWPVSKKPSPISINFSKSGYRRGLLLGILNPLAIPYWIGITAYLRSQQWIDTSSNYNLHAYLSGVVLGAFLLLISLAYLSKKVISVFTLNPWLHKIPGITLLCLGMYAFVLYLVG